MKEYKGERGRVVQKMFSGQRKEGKQGEGVWRGITNTKFFLKYCRELITVAS